jgi:hypothetical protein
MEPRPGALTAVGIVQLISGGLNLAMMWWLAGTAAGTLGGMCTGLLTLGVFPFGVLCGFVCMVLIPIGILEIVSGIIILAAPGKCRTLAMVTGIIELVSLVFGGLLSAIAGLVTIILMRDESVARYLKNLSEQ